MNRSKKERKLEFPLIEVLKITIKDGKSTEKSKDKRTHRKCSKKVLKMIVVCGNCKNM